MLTLHIDDAESAELSRYLGQNSIPALLREQSSQNDAQDGAVRQDMRSILGLDNSAPFPLMSSHHLDRMTRDISSELPSDREVMKYVARISSIVIQSLPPSGNGSASEATFALQTFESFFQHLFFSCFVLLW